MKVQILTTYKRVVQITVAVILAILALIGLYGFQFYQTQVSQPQEIFQRLLSVAKGEASLSEKDYDADALTNLASEKIILELQNDLSLVSGIEPEVSTQFLSSQATNYLDSTENLVLWITRELQSLFKVSTDWALEKIDSSQQRIVAGDICLLLSRTAGHWQLQTIAQCDEH